MRAPHRILLSVTHDTVESVRTRNGSVLFTARAVNLDGKTPADFPFRLSQGSRPDLTAATVPTSSARHQFALVRTCGRFAQSSHLATPAPAP